jgi:Tfp pilus assembly protein PilN
VKAVNLIPTDARSNRSGGSSSALRIPTYALLGVLAAALALVTVYVLTGNTIRNRTAQLSTLQTQVSQANAQAARLGGYGKFAQIAQTRLQTVAGIASTRFDWHTALADLSQVVPANTSLQSLSGTVAPGATTGGGSGGSGTGGGLRADEQTPALELVGCTHSQDDVARLMSRLRLIDGVTRVTLGSSQKATTAAVSANGTTAGCGSSAANFDMVVFFKTLPGAGPNGATSIPSVTTSTTPGGSS